MRMRNQSGGALIEFAIVVPLLLVVLFGIIDFSILLYDKAMITNASREGARAGIVFNNGSRIGDGDISNVVSAYCATHLISFEPGSTSVSTGVVRSGSAPGDSLTVTVTYRYQFLAISNLIALFGPRFGSVIDLSAVTVMRLE